MLTVQQRRKRWRRILAWSLAAGGLGLLILLTAFLLPVFHSDKRILAGEAMGEPSVRSAPPSVPRPAGVYLGPALAWREAPLGASVEPYRSQTLPGQFDADKDTELLLLSASGSSRLVQPGGQVRPVGVGCPEVMEPWAAWDYDGDGRDELVATCSVSNYLRRQGGVVEASSFRGGQTNLSLLTPVLDLEGRVVAQLPGQGEYGVVTGRFTGTKPQLVLQDATQPERYKRIFYGARGVKVAVLPLLDAGLLAAAGDIDGDGAQEVVDQFVRTDGEVRLRAFAPQRPVQVLYPAEYSNQFNVLDVTGDGRAEVFTTPFAYHDFAAGRDVELQFPPGFAPIYSERFGTISLAYGDFLRTGRRLIAMGYGPGLGITAILLFEPGGKCVYYEELGEEGEALVRLVAAGKDVLCVALRDRVRLCP